MILDEQNYIIMEQSGLPGGYGDSCAETSRYITLLAVIDEKVIIDLSGFVTDKGILRHPKSPWREDDTSLDQMYPLLAAASLTEDTKELRHEIDEYITGNRGRTYNDKILTLGMNAQIDRSRGKPGLDLALIGQALLFKIPFRWSDSKKKFEKNTDSSDYLNFVNGLAFAHLKHPTWASKVAKLLTNKDKVLQKIKDYYSPEPNSEWLIKIYEKALGIIYV